MIPSRFPFFNKNNKIYIFKILAYFIVNITFAQLHETPNCSKNHNLIWSTYPRASNEYGWSPGATENTFTNVDGSGTDISISFEGETSTFGFWAGQTPKVGSQSSYLHKGLDLLTNGFQGDGIICNIDFSKPIYILSFDIHHINFYNENGDKYIITGTDANGNIIYPELTPSPNPTYTIDNTTGTVNGIANITSGENPMVAVNFTSSNLIKSIKVQWLDCDDCSPQKPHATGFGNFSFCMPQPLGFDGIDDFISTDSFLGGKKTTTMMAWVKPEENSNNSVIIGQANCNLFIDENNRLKAFLKTEAGLEIETPSLENATLKDNTWSHIALSYNGVSGEILLYLNGNTIWQYNSGNQNTSLYNTEDWNSNYNFELGRHPRFKTNYFKGSINECRIYNKVLTLSQLQHQIFQKVHNQDGKVKGDIIPKAIEGLYWKDLLLYYDLKALNTGVTQDLSNNMIHGTLNNMDVFQEYTAPLPFVSKTSSTGSWNKFDNWYGGTSWDINEMPEFAIVEINGTLHIENNTTLQGLIVNNESSISVNENSGLFISEYLKLNGELYLKEGSQLIQNQQSAFDASSSGVLKKDVYGTADTYTYDYWSSPVSSFNSSSDNPSFKLKDIFENVTFLETGYNGFPIPLSIADYWIWKFCNSDNDFFTSWQHVGSSGEIKIGEGFTMKGPGSGINSEKQKYILSGKLNNGTILRNVSLGNDYLLGNPYPSAIDSDKFIKDNKDVFNGTLYFWQHWGDGTHTDSDFNGGYALYSLAGGVPAISKEKSPNDKESALINRSPRSYIPVGKGFYVTASKNGKIVFNNSQRVLSVVDNLYNDTTTENAPKKRASIKENKKEDSRTKIRINFHSTNNLKRQLLLTIDEQTSTKVDWGYDSKCIDNNLDDMYWMIANDKYVIQAIQDLNTSIKIPFGLHTSANGFNTITLDTIENQEYDTEIYIYDKLLHKYHNLLESDYKILLDKGAYLDRFELRFSNNFETLDTDTKTKEVLDIYFSKAKRSLVIENSNALKINNFELYTILGQSLLQIKMNSNSNIEYKIPENISGSYIFKINTSVGSISKKIAID